MGNSQITPSQFRKMFLDRRAVDAVACWAVADPLILQELKKVIKGTPNDFINLVEYLAENAENNTKAFQIHNLIHEAYGFVNRYADAWDALKCRKGGAAQHFNVYRRVLSDLDIPAHSIIQHVPRASKHWKDKEKDEVYDVLESLLKDFKVKHGVSLYEHYARIEDRVLESVQRTTGLSFESYKSSRVSGKSVY